MNAQATLSSSPAADAARAEASSAEAAMAPIKAKEVKHISPEKTELAEHHNNRHFAVAPKGMTPAELDMQPEPFALIAERLTRFDDIRVVAAEGTWLADFIVVECGQGYAYCQMTSQLPLPEVQGQATERIPDGFKIRQAGPGDGQEGWLVVRLKDEVVLNAGQSPMYRKEEAIRYLLDHPSVRSDRSSQLWHR